MKIYVCVKHVPDSAATITIKDRNRIEEDITFLMNPYDEHAISEAGRLKTQCPNTEVIAVSLSKPAGENTLRSALAMGADRGIHITTEKDHDAMTTARALRAAITMDGHPDLILTGKESIDNEGMQTMFRLAHHLGMPAATNVVDIRVQEDIVTAICEKEAGAREVLKLRLPCLLAAGKGLNTPRYPTFPDIVKSRKKRIDVVVFDQLGLPAPSSGVEIVHLEPAMEQRTPREIAGTPAEIALQIVTILKDEAKVI